MVSTIGRLLIVLLSLTDLLMLVLLDEETRGLGKEQQTDADDDGPEELHRDWNAIAAAVVSVLSCVVDDGRQE